LKQKTGIDRYGIGLRW